MPVDPRHEVYSAGEIARAAGVPEGLVIDALARAACSADWVAYEDAVRVGRRLRRRYGPGVGLLQSSPTPLRGALFSAFTEQATADRAALPLAASSALHIGVIVTAMVLTSLRLAPAAATAEPPTADLHLVFVAGPGPGGGGGGGGLAAREPTARARREGSRHLTSPVPAHQPPAPAAPPPPEPLEATPLPALVAPIAAVAADEVDQQGVVDKTAEDRESAGPGHTDGAGEGRGGGLGAGQGAGVGPGSGGGLGGGPFRPGAGIEPPRLLHEVKAAYTDAARRSGLDGEVVLEVVVDRTGSVREVRVVKPLGAGLDEAAVQAVRQWRFAPATRYGSPVDVVVEIAVSFTLR